MFNFKQVVVYKIEKKGKYETQYLNDYNTQEQVLLDDGFLKDNETEENYNRTVGESIRRLSSNREFSLVMVKQRKELSTFSFDKKHTENWNYRYQTYHKCIFS